MQAKAFIYKNDRFHDVNAQQERSLILSPSSWEITVTTAHQYGASQSKSIETEGMFTGRRN
jgi:hypothetical protein